MLAAIAPNGFVASLLVPIFFTFVILFSGTPVASRKVFVLT